MATSPVTSDHVSVETLRTLQLKAVDTYQNEPSLKSMLCFPEWRDTIEVYQSPKTMRKLGADTELATHEKVDVQTITIPEPEKFGTAYGITQDSLKRGVTSLQVMQEFATAIDSDRRLVAQMIVKTMLTDGGWWDGTVAPPRAANNSMTAAHEHYIAYNVAGVPILAHVARGKRLLNEHGITGDIIAMWNGDQIEKMEVAAEWSGAAARKSELLEKLQIKGFDPAGAFYTAGVLWIQNDYMPSGYGWMGCLNELYKPLAWRYAFQPDDTQDGLIRYTRPEDEQYYKNESFIRWGACVCAMRSLGVAIDLNHATYSAPATITEWDNI